MKGTWVDSSKNRNLPPLNCYVPVVVGLSGRRIKTIAMCTCVNPIAYEEFTRGIPGAEERAIAAIRWINIPGQIILNVLAWFNLPEYEEK